MATVGIALTSVGNIASSGLNAVMPTPDSAAYGTDSITSSASSQQSSITVPSDGRQYYWVVTVSGGDVWVKFGDDPTAAAGDGWLVADTTTRDWSAHGGQKAAIIDA